MVHENRIKLKYINDLNLQGAVPLNLKHSSSYNTMKISVNEKVIRHIDMYYFIVLAYYFEQVSQYYKNFELGFNYLCRDKTEFKKRDVISSLEKFKNVFNITPRNITSEIFNEDNVLGDIIIDEEVVVDFLTVDFLLILRKDINKVRDKILSLFDINEVLLDNILYRLKLTGRVEV